MDEKYLQMKNFINEKVNNKINRIKQKTINIINDVNAHSESLLLEVDEREKNWKNKAKNIYSQYIIVKGKIDTMDSILANIELNETEKKTYKDKIETNKIIINTLKSEMEKLDVSFDFKETDNFGELTNLDFDMAYSQSNEEKYAVTLDRVNYQKLMALKDISFDYK